MIALVFPFERGRYIHRLVARDGRVCLVERESTERNSRGHIHWEVVILQYEPERRQGADGRMMATGETLETYPRSSQWGRYGWTYTALEDARNRIRREAKAASAAPTPSPTPTQPLSGRASERARVPGRAERRTGQSGGGT